MVVWRAWDAEMWKWKTRDWKKWDQTKQVCVEPRPSLAAFSAKRGCLPRYRSIAGTIHICCPRPRSAANQPYAAAAVDRRNRQTDLQTSGRYRDRVPHTVRAASIRTNWTVPKKSHVPQKFIVRRDTVDLLPRLYWAILTRACYMLTSAFTSVFLCFSLPADRAVGIMFSGCPFICACVRRTYVCACLSGGIFRPDIHRR